MLLREIIAVFIRNINTLCGKNGEFLNAKTVVRRVIAVLQKHKAASDYGGEGRRCQQARGKSGRWCTSSTKKHLCVTHG
jgi:transposase InsO family protein